MASNKGRTSCPQCGANNFDTVTACWKCGAPLHPTGRPVAAPTPIGTPTPTPTPVSGGTWGSGPSGTALRAALWLGLLFPYVGLPVGLVFLMLDDDRRAEVGRACILWSCVSLLLHVLILSVIGVGMREVLFAMIQGARGAAARSGGAGGFGMP